MKLTFVLACFLLAATFGGNAFGTPLTFNDIVGAGQGIEEDAPTSVGKTNNRRSSAWLSRFWNNFGGPLFHDEDASAVATDAGTDRLSWNPAMSSAVLQALIETWDPSANSFWFDTFLLPVPSSGYAVTATGDVNPLDFDVVRIVEWGFHHDDGRDSAYAMRFGGSAAMQFGYDASFFGYGFSTSWDTLTMASQGGSIDMTSFQAVPEPAGISLMTFGLAALMLAGVRARHS